jgi:hypothetical protein
MPVWIIFDVQGVSTTPKVSVMGLLLRNLLRVQKVLGRPGTWISDIPAAASSWTNCMTAPWMRALSGQVKSEGS